MGVIFPPIPDPNRPGAAVIETDRWADSVLAKTQSIVIYFIPRERDRERGIISWPSDPM